MTTGEAGRGGPYVKAAFLCEYLLQEADNVASYIRVVDRVTRQAEIRVPDGLDIPPEVLLPEDVPEFTWNTTLVVSLVPGDARGRSSITLRLEEPSGLISDLRRPLDVHFDRPNVAANVRARMQLNLKSEGVYWIHVWADDMRLTQVPFEVKYQRL